MAFTVALFGVFTPPNSTTTAVKVRSLPVLPLDGDGYCIESPHVLKSEMWKCKFQSVVPKEFSLSIPWRHLSV